MHVLLIDYYRSAADVMHSLYIFLLHFFSIFSLVETMCVMISLFIVSLVWYFLKKRIDNLSLSYLIYRVKYSLLAI